MDGVTVSVLGALAALVVAIVLILKKVQPTYAMLIGAVAGGLIGGAGLTGTVNYIISGTQGIVSAIIRIVTAGILAGALIESGAAERIAEAIMNKLGAKRCLIAITLATWVLTAVGVFGDVACITVAPIALQMAKRAGYHKMGVLMAQLGAVRAGNVMSPNPNDIAAAEGFGVPLTSIIAVGIIPAAYDWSDIEVEARAAGVTAFCSKPMFLSDLRDTLLTAIGHAASAAAAEPDVLPEAQADFRGRRVLLVEDNELNREIAVEILHEYGFLVDTAENGAIAVDKVQTSPADRYDLVLMDIQMPVMDGYTATRRIRALNDPARAAVPIVAMTANVFEEERKRAFDCGMNGFLSKPLVIEALISALRDILH